MSKTATAATERDDAIAKLRSWLQPGDTVYTILRKVSRSGMSREIGVVLLQPTDGRIIDLHPNWAVSKATGYRLNKGGAYDAVILGGCGMDMGFALVYELSRVLYPDGYDCIGDGCPSNDHSNGDRNRAPHRHADGGYALRQRWL